MLDVLNGTSDGGGLCPHELFVMGHHSLDAKLLAVTPDACLLIRPHVSSRKTDQSRPSQCRGC